VHFIRAFLNVRAQLGADARKTTIAVASERCICVCACGVGHAVVSSKRTLVLVRALHAIADKPNLARACERRLGIGARGFLVAVVRLKRAFVNVGAVKSAPFVTQIAGAGKRCIGVCACRVFVAVVDTGCALVHVGTIHTVTCVPTVTCADKGRNGACASGVEIAVVLSVGHTLVNVCTRQAIARESSVAGTGEGCICVGAVGKFMTVVGLGGAFVDIDALQPVSRVPGVARAESRASRVGARCLCVTLQREPDI
jgi:hypothetical protein